MTYRRPTLRGGDYSAKPSRGAKNYSSLSSFHAQVARTNSPDSIRGRFPEILVGGRLKLFHRERQNITQDQWVLLTIKEGLKLEVLTKTPI